MLQASTLALALAVVAAGEPAPKRIGVLAFDAVGEVPADIVAAFAERLLVDITRLEGLRATGQSDIESMIDVEKLRIQSGAADEANMAALAGAAGMDLLITGTVVVDGGTYRVLAKLIDTATGQIETRSEQVVGRDTTALLNSADRVVIDLFRQSLPAPVDLEATFARRRNLGVVGWVTAGVGVAAVVAGAILVGTGIAARSQADRVYTEYTSAATPTDAGAQRDEVYRLIGEHNTLVPVGAVLLAVGGLAAGGALVAFLARPSVVPTVQVRADGAVVVLQGRF